MRYPFEASPDEVLATPELFVDAVFASLASEFLVMPKGEGFVEYPIFAAAYETLKKASDGFVRLDRATVLAVALQCPVVLLVLRAILGFTPPEWACVAASRKAMDIPQNAARTLDRRIRSSPNRPLRPGETTHARITALVETACDLIEEGCPSVPSDKLHRFSKVDSEYQGQGFHGKDARSSCGLLGTVRVPNQGKGRLKPLCSSSTRVMD